ncbi:trans-2,3-dihydro-3-hydroxyanthranilate isomerase [Thermopolyspora flexuosa]|uniref:Trans-2,3-dihydro-3-hydroxyanthranilate isomerase n=1 Tax=Thermopolyspora flexuosa TaxID=103836 RepID=A0A543IZ60_9ACTN|nr:trans-2,3-dihydro-3-hydroxyanthranilate isomerase [Thermopolyspora flexuosa]
MITVHPYVILDVFTDTPLEGNALAVFPKAAAIPSDRMQAIAREMNLSETVFILPAEGEGDARIRIFTPAAELPFAGHPTLGAAHFLAERDGRERVVLETGAGPVPVVFEREAGGDGPGRLGRGRMRQPIPTWGPYDRAGDVLAALGVAGAELPVELYVNGPRFVYVVLDDPARVAALRPDLNALAALGDVGVYCVAGSGTRWKARLFAPAIGVTEDPATGSAAGPAAVHLARHGRIAYGEEIEISQGAEVNRPSTLYARVLGEGDRIDAVEVGGSAVPVARGELLV